MEIRYLDNSGFALTCDREMLVFDCYNPKTHDALKDDALAAMNAVTVLISHAHGDHYSKDIWGLKNAKFASGFDIKAPEHAVSMKPGDTAQMNGASISAYGSTDKGVSFYVEWKGKKIFHAGDLNDWHWRDEGGEEYAKKAEAAFLKELALIQAGVSHIDIAFFPVDPRMGSDYFRGALLFCERMRPTHMVPMHFQNISAFPQAFMEEVERHTSFLKIPENGVLHLENEQV
ncbi:hypothetical protein LJC27_06905 [Christensenellaceae bacterium OttesenSCG-928-M15]|nr:hypothetical protein [Christensenellaceae bacterium OttesenSCG-928-M15]